MDNAAPESRTLMLPDGAAVTLEKDPNGRVWIVHRNGARESQAIGALETLFASLKPTIPAIHYQPDFNADDLCA